MGRVVKRVGHVVPGAILDARAEAERIVSAARAEAEAIRAAASAAVEEARRAGQAEGREAGRQAALGEAAELLARARADAETTRKDAAGSAVVLAARMAEKIVGHKVTTDPSVMADIAAQALKACRARTGPVTLRVAPSALAALEQARPALLSALGGVSDLRLVVDQAVAPGGCVVDTPVGRLDARLETQVAALEAALAARRAGI
jgi:type III secretion system HrpE/YscL family protein